MAEDRVIVWNFVRYTLTPFRDGWRIRSRRIGNEIDWQFPCCGLETARELALARFQGNAPAPIKNDATLEDVIEAYKEIPKRAGEAAAKQNIYCLRSVTRVALGKEAKRVYPREVGPDLWAEFQRRRLDGRLDYSTRRPGNAAINSTIRCAKSIFIPELVADYARRGIEIPANATVVKWLPEMQLPKPEALEASLFEHWAALPHGDTMRDAIGLGRFAGLRREEASACQRDWIVENKDAVYVELRDRPNQGFLTKTGKVYRALVVNDAYAAELLAKPPGYIVQMPERISSREEWFERKPQDWLRPFLGGAKKPFHRLRGLYADEVARMTQDAVAAHLAGVKAASEALGHTSTQTTKDHYLTQS